MTQSIDKQVRTFTPIESESHFRAISLEMLGADFVPCADDSALEKRERRFDSIGVNIALHVDSELVLDSPMLWAVSSATNRTAILMEIISQEQFNILGDVLSDVLFKRAGLHVRSMKESQLPAALPNADYDLFVFGATPRLSVMESANISFVHFDLASEKRLLAFDHCVPNTMAEIPGSFITADSESALNLASAHALLCFAEKQGRKEPLVERQMRVVKNRASGNGELIIALFAVKQLLLSFELNDGHFATRAFRASGPAETHKHFAALLIRREHGVYIN